MPDTGFSDAAALAALAGELEGGSTETVASPTRLFSIWEVTTWILPMAAEHLRRQLAAHPDLPQGQAGGEGGTRWFSVAEVAALRAHFAQGARKARYLAPRNPTGAPFIVMAQPLGGAGKTVMLLHLAIAAAIAGLRVLVIDGDPVGRLGRDLGVMPGPGALLPLIARSAGQHLTRINEGRIDRGEAPLPLDPRLSLALQADPGPLVQPSHWHGLDVLPAGDSLMQADLVIAAWQRALPRWQPRQALLEGMQTDGLRHRYDLILCDTGRGLGPLAITLLTAADALLAPLKPRDAPALSAGLAALATAVRDLDASAQITAQALGQGHRPQTWRRLAILPTCMPAGTPLQMTTSHMLPAALPEVRHVTEGKARCLYDMDYRSIGRLAYAPLRDAAELASRALISMAAEV